MLDAAHLASAARRWCGELRGGKELSRLPKRLTLMVKVITMEEKKCASCEAMKKELEELRTELCVRIQDYTGICQRLWKVINTKRNK